MNEKWDSWINTVTEELQKNNIDFYLKKDVSVSYPSFELYTNKENVDLAEEILLLHVPAIVGRKVISR